MSPPRTLALALLLPATLLANDESAAPLVAGVVVITGSQPSSLPTRIPTTLESSSAAQIETAINASDSEDALKYLPSLLVRKRYIGDYNHAVLSTRASGTGNSARSLVYADGVRLSNLLGNGAAFAPRWGLVTPEEIARVDVLYGPFSAAYPGNAVGAVVDFVTRMPSAFEAHAKVGWSSQPNTMYGASGTYDAWQTSASIGSRDGALAWWLDANRLDSSSQPLTFATRQVSAGGSGGGVAVTGAVLDNNRSNQPWYLLGAATQYDTTQDHLKAKLAYDLSPTLRAIYTLGLWRNRAVNASFSYLRDGSGRLVDNTSSGDVSQAVSIDGKRFTLAAGDFPKTRETLEHTMHALSLKTRTQGDFDWELAASRYDYNSDRQRAYAPTSKAAPDAGRITDMGGTGWDTLKAAFTWRPHPDHVIDGGAQQDGDHLSSRVDNLGDWVNGAATSFNSRFEGRTQIQAAYAQDASTLNERWTTVLGLRVERWRAWNGITESAYSGAADQLHCGAAAQRCRLTHPARALSAASPKAALAYALDEAWTLKASTGRAVRFPTVSELYQGGINALGQAVNNNPDLRPERSWTQELSAEQMVPGGSLRATLFHEDTRDALYSQLNSATNANTVQNVKRIRTLGLELAASTDRWLRGLQLQGSLTYADSRILANDGYVSTPGDTIGRQQPRVPRWRASALASWAASDRLSVSYGARYSGPQYSTLDNSDPNGFAYQGASKYFSTDLRLRYRIDSQWSTAFGIDNLNNYRYWNFHPYPQRSFSAELRFDL